MSSCENCHGTGWIRDDKVCELITLRKRVAELKAENEGLRDANMAMCMRVRDLEADSRDL